MKDLLTLIKKVPFIIEGYLLFILVLGEIELRTENERLGDSLWRIVDPHVRLLIIWPFVALVISLVLIVGKKYTITESLIAIIGNVTLIYFVIRFLAHVF